MENISQMSLLEVAVKLMEQKRSVQNIKSLIKEVLEMKGLNDEDGEYTTQLYIDITTSSKFVYMGNDEWDLKTRQPLEQYDKDGSAFNSKDEVFDDEDEIDSLDEDDLETEEDEESDDEEDEEIDEFDEESEDEEDEESDDDYEEDEEDDELNDGEELERYTEEGFNEDKYNDYMDDYEDMYDDN